MSGDANDDERGSGHSSWRVMELLFGGGVIVWGITTTVASVWWAAVTDAKLQRLNEDRIELVNQINSLDNVALGNRITALESQIAASNKQLDAIDGKLDRLIAGRREPN